MTRHAVQVEIPAPDHSQPGDGMESILIVDDELVIRELLSDFLRMEGFQVMAAEHGAAALRLLDEHPNCHLVITDLKMPVVGGLELLDALAEHHPDIVSLIMTGYGTVETAIDAMKRGAFDYILKPFKIEAVVETVRKALEHQRLRQENIALKAALSLHQLAEHLSDQVELAPTLRYIVETVKPHVRAHSVSMILFPEDGAGDSQRPAGASIGADVIAESDLTEAGRALGQPVLARGAAVFELICESERTESISSLIALPLTNRGAPLGLLLASRRGGRHFREGQRKLLTIIADRAAVAVRNAQLFEKLERSFVEMIETLATALEEKDPYTRGHSERVARFARATARELGLSEKAAALVYQGGRLHDIGKLALRAEELNKPAGLTEEETQRFQRHPSRGESLLSAIPLFQDILPAVGGHHERFDGSGYPRGLAGEAIPVMARIMAVADAYDAMTSHRAYRRALPHESALAELRRGAGTQFDPGVVQAFAAAIERLRR